MTSRRTFVTAALAGTATAIACRREAPAPGGSGAPSGSEDRAWAAIRGQFEVDPAVTYLNNASLGLPPRPVAVAVAGGYRLHSRDPLHAKHQLSRIVAEESIPALARLLGVEPDELALTRNATEALHLQTVGLLLAPGDEVVTTTQEHPAGIKPWRYRAARGGVVVKEVFIPSPFGDAEDVVGRLREAIGPRTKALACCHVTRGGHLYPVREVCELARERGLASLIDGAQAVGMFPVDLRALGCDAYSASLHKWLLGPVGTGVWFLRRDARPRWRSAFEPDPTIDQPGLAPGGTADLPLRAAIATAVRFAERIGLRAIESRCRYLSDHLKRRLAAIPAAQLVSGPTPRTSAPGSTIFVLGPLDPFTAVATLDERRLHIDEHVRDGHPAFRISTHYYNTTEEVDRAVESLAGLLPT